MLYTDQQMKRESGYSSSVVSLACRWCFHGGTAAWRVTEKLGIDSFQADNALTADFSAPRREETAQHFRTISSLIDHVVRP